MRRFLTFLLGIILGAAMNIPIISIARFSAELFIGQGYWLIGIGASVVLWLVFNLPFIQWFAAFAVRWRWMNRVGIGLLIIGVVTMFQLNSGELFWYYIEIGVIMAASLCLLVQIIFTPKKRPPHVKS
ncbi:hypothetical protein [Marinococcus sp. PL1-022]|uniref:hypothetical protein n=1 Tax=Marinococcus sp. PL1-022 TaxID=3095363 RepID=UPI0029C5B884|nr:hypothetical protein [Marinococcus sp. PL1-022]MDX6151596.1 hypothetical protein [Marinococcus sp. PL1-022]